MKPTRKWWTLQITAISGWVIALIQNGYTVNDTLAITAVTIVAQAATTYLVPNESTPGGVPK